MVITLPQNPESPASQSPQVQAVQPDLRLVRDLWTGQRALDANRRKYLPQHPREDADDYIVRTSRPVFFNAFARSVRAFTGMVFSNEPQLVGVPQPIVDLYSDDLDGAGTAGLQVLEWLFRESLITGFSLVLVDAPQAPEGDLTLADERDLGLRPYWRVFRRDDLLSYRWALVNGRKLLTQVVLRDFELRDKSTFGVEVVTLYRVFRLTPDGVTFQVWEQSPDQGEPRPVESGMLRGPSQIPLAVCYAERKDLLEAPPPLLDLANLNLQHFQVASDLAHAINLSSVPVLFGAGVNRDEGLVIGPNAAVTVNDPNASLQYVETSGAGISATRQHLHDLETRMASLALGQLQRPSRAAETAESARLKKSDQDAPLVGIVREFEDGITAALWFTAQYLGLSDGGRISFNTDFPEPQQVAMTRPELESQFGLDQATGQTEE